MSGMSKIVKTITSIAFPFVMIYGLYIIAHGHLTPGGGFQGGAIVASGAAMILVAYGSIWTMGKVKEKYLSVLESTGAIVFIGTAIFGLLFAGIFFNNFLFDGNIIFNIIPEKGSTVGILNSAGTLPIMNFAVGLKVIAGLFVIVLVMAYATTKMGGGKK